MGGVTLAMSGSLVELRSVDDGSEELRLGTVTSCWPGWWWASSQSSERVWDPFFVGQGSGCSERGLWR